MINYPAPDLALKSGSIAIAASTLAFLVYLFIFSSGRFNNWLLIRYDARAATIRRIVCQRLFGALVFGLVPVLITLLFFQRPLSHYGLSGEFLMKNFLWWIPTAAVVIFISYLGARNVRNLAMYPQIRSNLWDRQLLFVSGLSWVIYLVGYEFMFRGFLLFSCLENFGYWPAIFINISLYSLFHIHKGSREAVGSLFFGFIICYLTLYLGSLWFAVFIHITMALSNEWISLGFQPDMHLVKKMRKG